MDLLKYMDDVINSNSNTELLHIHGWAAPTDVATVASTDEVLTGAIKMQA